MAPIPQPSLDLNKCFSGEQQLITWDIAYNALCDPVTAAKSQSLLDFLSADENTAILSKPWNPFPAPSPQETAKFESATAPISVTPAQNGHYNLDEIKNDSVWLAKQVQISDYAALRLVVQEWQTRPHMQLLEGLTEEEVLSVKEAAGLGNLKVSTFAPNASILRNVAEQTGSQFDSPEQRKLRLIGIYFSTCAAILRVSQMLVAWGVAGDLRASETMYTPDYCIGQQPFEPLGQAIAKNQNDKEGTSSKAPALDRCFNAVKQRIEALNQGCAMPDLPESIQDDVEAKWAVCQTTQLVHVLHLALMHIGRSVEGLIPTPTLDLWFGTLAEVGFFQEFPIKHEEQGPLVRLIQVLTSMISVAILKPRLVFDDLDSGNYNEWTPDCYPQDSLFLDRLTDCLANATELGATPVHPAIFTWANIVGRLTMQAQALEQARDGLLESAPDSRRSLPAPSRLEEALHSMMRTETGDSPIAKRLAERCLEQQVFPIMQSLLESGMAGFGTIVDQVSRDRFRLLYLQVIRATMSTGAIEFGHDGLLDLVHQILIGERTFQEWSAHDGPCHADPVVKYACQFDEVLRLNVFEPAGLHYPIEVHPLLMFTSALVRGWPTGDGETAVWDTFLQLRWVTQQLPVDFVDYRLEQEEFNENRVSLTTDLPQFTSSSISKFSNRRLLASSTPSPSQAFMVVEKNTLGIIINEQVQPYVARWLYQHSALDYFFHLLSTYVVGSTKVVYATQSTASTADAAKIIELFADIMHAALQASRARGEDNHSFVDVLTTLNIGTEQSPDTVSIVLSIFEEELLRQYQDPANRISLQLLVACTHFIKALIAIAPSRVWPWLARSRLLESGGNGGSLASILISTEMVLGEYKFLIGCIHMFNALVDDAVERSVSRKTSNNSKALALTRFNAPATSESGTSEKIMSTTLLTFGRTLASIYETSLGWKYNGPEDRLHINIGICEAFTNILHVAYSVDDAPELSQKLTKVVGSTASYITDLYITETKNDLPTNPILSSLLAGTDLVKNTTLTSWTALSKRQTQATLRFSEVLVRVAVMLEKPWTHLEQQLFKATPLLARLYVTSEAWKSPVVTLLETLVRGAIRAISPPQENGETPKKGGQNEPPSLLGHLGSRTAKNFMTVLSQLDEPLRIVDIQQSVWNLLTAVVTCKQQWFALYLLTGNTPRETMRSKSKTAAQISRSKSLLSRALDVLSRLDLESRTPAWSLWTAMLEFITAAQNHWSWAMGDLRDRKDFIQQLITFVKWMSRQPEPKEDTAIALRSYQNKFASLTAELLAMYLHAARQVGDNKSFKDILGGLSYYQNEALRLPSFNVALHANLKKNIERNIPGVQLDNFKRTTLQSTSYGPNFFYDVSFASTLLEFDSKWSGPRRGQGFKTEVERANLNLGLVDSQIQLLHSWRLLALELGHFATKDGNITTGLISIVKACMKANASSSLPEALFGQLMVLRADLAFALLKRLVENKVKSEEARQLLGPVWAAVRATTADFDNVFSTVDVDYYRSLLRILYLTLHFYLIDPSDKVDSKEASFRSSFRGTIAKQGNEPAISIELLEILSDTVAKGFRSLATQLHDDPSSVSPSDFALLTALLQRITAIPEMATSHSQIALLFANSNTIRYATSLFSWADKLMLDTGSGTPDDPVYGELSLLFLLSLSSIKPLAETMAVEGILSQLNTANLMNYFRRPGGMGPFDNPPRMHAIWMKGILPLCLNLLLAVGPPLAAEISSFLNAYPEQLARSSNAFNARHLSRITLNLAAETHSLAVISSIVESVRTAGVGVGVQSGDVASLDWDGENVREDLGGWLERRNALAERVVGDEEVERRVVGELMGAVGCLGVGKGAGGQRP